MIKTWLNNNRIKHEFISANQFIIEGVGNFLVIKDKDKVLDDNLTLILGKEESILKPDFYCFKWGVNFYYSSTLKITKFDPLKYIGEIYDEYGFGSFPFLGVHGGYEILNGSTSYSDWVKKANFSKVSTLGICEKNTLGGALKFQLACEGGKLNYIIGEEITVKSKGEFHNLKLFVKDTKGWKNLLLINREINVINPSKFIEISKLLDFLEGLIIVFDPKHLDFKDLFLYDLHLGGFGENIYYQLDTVIFEDQEKDKNYLNNLKSFLYSELKPVLINDAYYLEKEEFETKNILNSISGIREYKSKNQHFKTISENFEILNSLFLEEDTKFIELFEQSLENLRIIETKCSKFKIQTKVWHLPEYLMTEDEVVKYKTKKSLFLELIQNGLDNKIPQNELKIYKSRVEEEYPVIVNNGYIDYFLILWDIIKWAKSQGILVGIARGSAGGSLIAFLMSITEIDPIKYDLLFSRFLNEGRAKVSVPDIDTDFQASRREEVKKYMENKYGENQVCSVGTYTNLKLKASIKDVSRLKNIPFAITNYISQLLDIENGNWYDIFKTATHKGQIKDFISKYPDVIEDMKLILNQPKSQSVHACAVLILPKRKPVYEWIPVRLDDKDGEKILVSEWEGVELETAGFLKEDILGIKQLDKYAFILDLIKKNEGEEIDIYSLPLNDKSVYNLFKNGCNGDVFHFGSIGLTGYCKELKPENIEDLIAAISLFRPGAIENNFHNEYILRKEGKREIEYFVGSESVLESTYGVFVYQEQIMKICQVLGGLTLVEADDVRRAMVKKKYEALHQYKLRFIPYYQENFGVTKEYSEEVWNIIDKASSYLFNKSHASAYAVTGYIGQWLKQHYPVEYWTSAFQFDDPNPKNSNIPRFISEIHHMGNFLKIMPPEINESGETFLSNKDKMELYWSINKVKQVGEKALEAIISERSKNGSFFSLEEFLCRIDKRVVNKAVVINLILSGSFDVIENINYAGERKRLINKYYKFLGTKRAVDDIYLANHEDYFWQIKQKELSGLGEIDYIKIISDKTDFNIEKYYSVFQIENKPENSEVITAGIIKSVIIRTTKKNDDYCKLLIDNNNEEIEIIIWSDKLSEINREDLKEGNILIFKGKVINDTYKHKKVIHSNEKTKIYFFN